MSNKRYSDVHPCKDEKDSCKPVPYPKGKIPPSGTDFKQHPAIGKGEGGKAHGFKPPSETGRRTK